jgi:hypothetical protein
MNQQLEKEVREAQERRSAGRAVRRQQEAEALAEEQRSGPDTSVEVLEVNGEGQPKLVRTRDRGTNAVGVVEMVGGYRQPSGAVHAYDPLDALNRKE